MGKRREKTCLMQLIEHNHGRTIRDIMIDAYIEHGSERAAAKVMISETIWNEMWREWQDRRNQIRFTLESLQQQQEIHINNLDTALEIIAQVGIVYNTLERSD